ncbi:MAG: hypothetical protein ACTTIO_04225 [Candidatus Fimenecus sp.]
MSNWNNIKNKKFTINKKDFPIQKVLVREVGLEPTKKACIRLKIWLLTNI